MEMHDKYRSIDCRSGFRNSMCGKKRWEMGDMNRRKKSRSRVCIDGRDCVMEGAPQVSINSIDDARFSW
jgi:hypothetical protein